MKMNINNLLKDHITENGLPQNTESETAIASILINNNAVMEVLTEHGIGREHFHNVFLKDVYSTCSNVIDDGKDIDPLVMINILRKKYDEQVIRKNVLELAEANILTEALQTHIDNVIEFKLRRDSVVEGFRLVKKAYSDNGEFKVKIDPFFEDLTVQSLMKMDFPEPKWIIPSTIPEGLTIVSGRPKVGKSIFSLNLAISVATGGMALGKIRVEKTGVLYLALEDTLKRLKKRFGTVLQGQNPPGNLYLNTEFKTIKDGGLEQLKSWLNQHKDVGLVIIDTLAKIKGQTGRNSELYVDDYVAIARIKAIADKNGIGIVLVHHTRKAESEDVFDTILGTTGITGAADTIIILKKERGMAAGVTLHVCGRDVEEAELALKFDPVTMGWVFIGDAKEYRITEDRKEIVKLLRDYGHPMYLREIAKGLGKKEDTIGHLARKLVNDGILKQPKYGKYTINDNKTSK